MLTDGTLKHGPARLYAILAQYDDTPPAKEVLARQLGVSKRAVEKWLADLKQRGAIRVAVKGGKHGPNVYEFPQLEPPRDLAS